MCDGGNDYEEPLTQAWRRARKEHRCFACHETIRAGDHYHYIAQMYEGDFNTYKHCARCRAMIDALFAAGASEVQWDLHCGTPWEEAFGGEPTPEIAALAFMTPDEAQMLAREE
jgi:hypothetical protein